MPNELEFKDKSIYDDVIVVLTDSKDYKIINTRNNTTVNTIKVRDADTALAIKKAYCDGYYDGKHQ